MSDDTLRDELAEAIYQRRLQGSKVEPGPLLLKVLRNETFEFADAALPVVRRYADAQVAAERERIAASLREAVEAVLYDGDNDRPLIGYYGLLDHADRIARGQP
jgi:hypothetical protein